MSDRVNMAKVMSVIGRQISNATHMVRMKEASAMRADMAAVSEVGGDSSPQTESRKTKKCATQGLTPSLVRGPTMTTAPMMWVAVGGRPMPPSHPKRKAIINMAMMFH